MQDPREDLDRIDEWVQEESNVSSNIFEPIEGSLSDLDIDVDPSIEIETLGHEVRHVFSSMIAKLTIDEPSNKKIISYVTCEGKPIAKSTLNKQLLEILPCQKIG